ncbi:hypothetical protein GCM10025734_12370 [Kitasatospora paranensis]
MPPCEQATFLPIRSLTVLMGEPFFTRMPSPAWSGAVWAKSLKPGFWASAATAEVMEPWATSSCCASRACAAGANGPALPVQATLACTAARALSSEPSFFPLARKPELPGSGIRSVTSEFLLSEEAVVVPADEQAVGARAAAAVRAVARARRRVCTVASP